MRCDSCQYDNVGDANYCVNCGVLLTQRCSKCGHGNPGIARFCASCGQALQPAQRGYRIEPSTAASASSALLTRAARDGERKRVTVLFADVAGSTALIDGLDPEDAADRLGAVTAAMREAVSRFEGSVNKLQGDGVMALFGAPIPQEDHAVRACCAGLAMIENVKAISGAPPIRVGIHTGEVVVRALSNDISTQYDAMGVAVHIASRLEHEAAEFGVAISAATLSAAGDAVDAEPLRHQSLRGISEPVAVYALRRIRPAGQPFRSGQRLSPFVGRELEELVLLRALKAAAIGASRVVGVVGEAGSGKSRLLFEFLERCRMEGRPILEARATAHGRARPLQPVLELIRSFFGVADEVAPGEAAGRIQQALERLGCPEHAALLLDFLGLPVGADATLPRDVTDRRMKLLQAVQHVTRAVASARPSILAVEDLHWLDHASEPFIEAIADSIAGTPTLMLVNFRPGYRAAWMERSYYEQISLVPLPVDAVETMLDRTLGRDGSLDRLRGRLITRAAGNPFFVEELVRALIGQGILAGAHGAYRASTEAQSTPLPTSVQSVLGSRIDRLAEPDKLLIQAASVVGREFPLPVVAEIAETTVDDARHSLNRLLVAEMLALRPEVHRDELEFRHPLVQEAAYGSLLSERRRNLHRRAAQALDKHFRERPDEHAALIGHHWEQAGEPVHAAACHVKSALWIGSRDPRQALESWRRVRHLLNSQASSPQVDYTLMMACGQIVNYAWREGIDAAEIEPIFRQAMDLATRLKDMRAAALITMAFGRALVATGSADDYVSKVEDAQRLIGGSASASVEAVLAAVHSHALSTAGRLEDALAANEIALGRVHKIEPLDRRTLGFHPEHWLMAQRARTLMLLGRMAEAEPLVRDLLEPEGEPVDTLHRALAISVRLEAAACAGSGASAVAHADALAALLQGSETPYLRVLGGRYRAIALFAAGMVQDAVQHLDETIAYARTHRAGLEMEPFLLADMAKALMGVDIGRARESAAAALELAERRAMRVAAADAASVLARAGVVG